MTEIQVPVPQWELVIDSSLNGRILRFSYASDDAQHIIRKEAKRFGKLYEWDEWYDSLYVSPNFNPDHILNYLSSLCHSKVRDGVNHCFTKAEHQTLTGLLARGLALDEIVEGSEVHKILTMAWDMLAVAVPGDTYITRNWGDDPNVDVPIDEDIGE